MKSMSLLIENTKSFLVEYKINDVVILKDIKSEKGIIKSDPYKILGIQDDLIQVQNTKTGEKIIIIDDMIKGKK